MALLALDLEALATVAAAVRLIAGAAGFIGVGAIDGAFVGALLDSGEVESTTSTGATDVLDTAGAVVATVAEAEVARAAAFAIGAAFATCALARAATAARLLTVATGLLLSSSRGGKLANALSGT